MLNRKEIIRQMKAVSTGSVVMGFSGISQKWIEVMKSFHRLNFLTSDLHVHPGCFYQNGIDD